ncbi:MAG: CPBP family glutamic-type intramembrane protease [Candidatus Wallbacteria bacterium]|nr:CPBP family glutamic-type intramembrane protease [Candidatus Wallbacteria bacterium]
MGKKTKAALLFFCLYPAIVDFLAINLSFQPFATYGIGKLIMIAIPLIVWYRSGVSLRVLRLRIGLARISVVKGLLTGTLMSALIYLAYNLFFKSMVNPGPIIDRLYALDLTDHYITTAFFLSFSNSLMEEYYWRGFILDQMKKMISGVVPLCILNGIFFSIHHFAALLPMFRLNLTLAFAAATGVAAAVWSWQRLAGQSLLDCYVSHVLADLAIFYVGWEVIQ